MKELTIPIELANAISAYLAQKPYGEVCKIMAALAQSVASQKEMGHAQPKT